MKCKHCGHHHTIVCDVDKKEEGILRYRRCLCCSQRFTTMERVSDYSHAQGGYVDIEPAAQEQEPVPAPAKATRIKRFMPDEVPDEFGVTDEAAPLLLQWWSESRRSKHASKATWTEAAWLSSVKRVGKLPPARQLALCSAGVENGWMALKEEYLGKAPMELSVVGRRPMPKDPSMLAALEEPWPA